MLSVDHAKRITAKDAMSHAYFAAAPEAGKKETKAAPSQ